MWNKEIWNSIDRTEETSEQLSLQETYLEARELLQTKRTGERFSNHFKAKMWNGRMNRLMQNLNDNTNNEAQIGKIDTESKTSKINESVKVLLSDDIPSWIPVIWSPEYQQLKDKITDIYNNVKLGVPDNLINYTLWTVYDNWNVKILTIQDSMDSSKNVKITFNKQQNRFSVTKDWEFITSKSYI